MTLARTTLFVICTNDLGRAGRNYRQPPRPNAASTFDIRRSRADSPPSGTFVRRHTGSNAHGRLRRRPLRSIMSSHNAKTSPANVSPPFNSPLGSQ